MTAQPTCEERVEQHRDSRLADFRDFANLMDGVWNGPGPEAQAAAERLEVDLDVPYADDAVRERLAEYPLGVSAYTTFRVDISTGGPGEWLEVVCSERDDGVPRDISARSFDVERIVFHFVDWFDHAQRTLEGDDFNVAERMAREWVPELVE